MEAKKLPAGLGWLWIKQGTYLFRKSPILWVTITLIGIAGLIGIASIPVIGDPLATLLFPVMFSGLLWGCHALEHDEELELAHLFAGFHRNTQQLVMLGGLNLVGQLLIFGVMMVTGGAALVGILMSGTPPEDPNVIAQAAMGAGFAILLGLALFCALLMATQFAPMLVTFEQISPFEALKTSLRACWHNLAPLSVYGLMMMLFALAASLPMMLGWFILLPIMITSIYAAYRGIFPREEAPADSVEADTAADQSPPQGEQ
ncbi:MAG: hypothetical protein EPO42_07355 [Gallionellaceae bacterium]|nr:MAG: hypothetical protein EPO42_07355 [Gallionellaceae bacterium]